MGCPNITVGGFSGGAWSVRGTPSAFTAFGANSAFAAPAGGLVVREVTDELSTLELILVTDLLMTIYDC
jgi:hypothetical protein